MGSLFCGISGKIYLDTLVHFSSRNRFFQLRKKGVARRACGWYTHKLDGPDKQQSDQEKDSKGAAM